MAELSYPMVVKQLKEDEGGGFMAFAPDLYGCMGSGETAEEAVSDLLGAIDEWIDEARRLGRDVPEPGAMAKKARRTEKGVRKLLEAQDKLIEEQDQVINDQRREIERIRETLALQNEGVSVEDRSYAFWSDRTIVSRTILIGATKKAYQHTN